MIPGTRSAWFHTALDHQLAGREAEFRKIMANWNAASARKENDYGTGLYSCNQSLSSRRAAVVKDFLTNAGVASAQIVTIGKGTSQPRRPNLTETGEAPPPEGRRANRRTEIYLDF